LAAREASLFELAGGSALEGFFLLKASGGNIPPLWITRTRASRRKRHVAAAKILKKGNWGGLGFLREWEDTYDKECFYNGIRILFELERQGKSTR
jgi:hypothetical protein